MKRSHQEEEGYDIGVSGEILPLELWALIFSFTVDKTRPRWLEIPLLFTEICKQWRDEASRLFAPALLDWLNVDGHSISDAELDGPAYTAMLNSRCDPRPYVRALFRRSRREMGPKSPSLHLYRCADHLAVIRNIHAKYGYAGYRVGQPHSRTADKLYLLEERADKSLLLSFEAYKTLMACVVRMHNGHELWAGTEPTGTTRIGELRYDIDVVRDGDDSTPVIKNNKIDYRSYLQCRPGTEVQYTELYACEWRLSPPITYEAGYVVPAVWPTDGTQLDRTAVVSALPIADILWYLNNRATLYDVRARAYGDIVEECGGLL